MGTVWRAFVNANIGSEARSELLKGSDLRADFVDHHSCGDVISSSSGGCAMFKAVQATPTIQWQVIHGTYTLNK